MILVKMIKDFGRRSYFQYLALREISMSHMELLIIWMRYKYDFDGIDSGKIDGTGALNPYITEASVNFDRNHDNSRITA